MTDHTQNQQPVIPQALITAAAEIARFFDAIYGLYCFGKHIPGFKRLLDCIPEPYKGLLLAGAPCINDLINMILKQALTKSNPLAYIKSLGNGHTGIGLAKITLSILFSLAAVSWGGYSLEMLRNAYQPSDTNDAHGFAYMISEPAIIEIAFGTVGYGLWRLLRKLSLQCLNACWPQGEEVHTGQLNIAQIGLQQFFRVFGSWVGAQAIYHHADYFGLNAATLNNPQFNQTAWVLADTSLTGAKYLGDRNNFLPVEESNHRDLEADAENAHSASPGKKLAQRFCINTLGIMSGAYAIGAIICQFNTEGCEQDSLAVRAKFTAETFLATAMLDTVIENTLPYLKPKITQCVSSFMRFFNPNDRQAEQDKLLQDTVTVGYQSNV